MAHREQRALPAGVVMAMSGRDSPLSSTPRLPVPPEDLAGRVIRVLPHQSWFRSKSWRLHVEAVRVDISLFYDGNWVWVDGDEVDDAGQPIGHTQALLHVSVFADAALPPPE